MQISDLIPGFSAVSVVALADGANIATDASLGGIFTVTLAGNRTLDDPSNLVTGKTYAWVVSQDSNGIRTLAYGSIFAFSGGATPVLQTGASKVSIILAFYDGVKLRASMLGSVTVSAAGASQLTFGSGGGLTDVGGYAAVVGAGLTDAGSHYFIIRESALNGRVYVAAMGTDTLHLLTNTPATCGVVIQAPGTAPADGVLATRSISFYLNETTHHLLVKWKESDGTTFKTLDLGAGA